MGVGGGGGVGELLKKKQRLTRLLVIAVSGDLCTTGCMKQILIMEPTTMTQRSH